MFTKIETRAFRPLIEGVTMRPLSFGDKTILCEFRLQKGNSIPAHNHPYEQTGYVVSGQLNIRIADEWFLANAGDSWCIAENIEHEVEILDDSVVLELFSPVRPDYLP